VLSSNGRQPQATTGCDFLLSTLLLWKLQCLIYERLTDVAAAFVTQTLKMHLTTNIVSLNFKASRQAVAVAYAEKASDTALKLIFTRIS